MRIPTRPSLFPGGLLVCSILLLSSSASARGEEGAARATADSERARPAAATSVILQKNRIRVSVTWKSQYTGASGEAQVIPQADEFAYFYFSDPNNPEVFVKVLDFGEPNPFLAFYSGLTDFEYTVTYDSLCNNKKLVVTKPAGSYTGGGDNKALTWCTTGTGVRPVANFSFSPSSPVAGQKVTFTNDSTNALTYYWDFSDGETSTEMNPVKTFKNSGTFNVLLAASNTYGTASVKKDVTVRPPQTAPMRVNITNTLVEGIDVWVDGNPVGSIPVGETRGFDVVSATGQVRIDTETFPLKYPSGTVIPGSKTLTQHWTLDVVSGAVRYLETAVRFASTNESFYAPLLTNSTTVQLMPVVNHLDPYEFACPCAILPGTRNAYVGYYQLLVTSRFSIFRVNEYPNGPNQYWQNFGPYWNDRSGAVLFNATLAPTGNRGGEPVEIPPPPGVRNLGERRQVILPDSGTVRTPAFRGPYLAGPLPALPVLPPG